MPAGYQSTARALSLSPSSPNPISSPDDAQPPWGRARPNSTRRSNEQASYRDQIIQSGTELYERMDRMWQELSLLQKIGVFIASLVVGASGIGFLVLTGKVFVWLGPVAEKWETSWRVAFVMWLCVFFVSFPPLLGWSTFGTVAGFIFGVWKG